MHYEFTIGEDSRYAKFYGGCGYPICDVSMIMSHTDIAPGIPLNKDGNPPPSGAIFENTENTDEYTWYPFPFHIWDLRGSKDSKYCHRNIYEDIMNGELTKDNIDNFDDIRPSAKTYIKTNYDWYIDIILKGIIDAVIKSLGASVPEDILSKLKKYLIDRGDELFKLSKEEVLKEAETFISNSEDEIFTTEIMDNTPTTDIVARHLSKMGIQEIIPKEHYPRIIKYFADNYRLNTLKMDFDECVASLVGVAAREYFKGSRDSNKVASQSI